MIVTGASRGIGAATARLAATQGYRVSVNYVRNQEAAEAVVRDVEEAGGRALAVAADVGRQVEVNEMFNVVERELGPLTALVNNAGILERQMRVEDMDEARLNRIFTTNVTVASYVHARRCGACPPSTAALEEPSSTSPRPQRAWDRPANTWTTPPPRERSTR